VIKTKLVLGGFEAVFDCPAMASAAADIVADQKGTGKVGI